MEPFIQGWYSPLYQKAIANYAHSIEKTGSQALITTLLLLSDTKDPLSNIELKKQGSDFSACWTDSHGKKDGVVMSGENLSVCQ